MFKEALELSPKERKPFLAVSCAGEEGLRDEVEGLLSAHAKAKDFIESPAPFPSTMVDSRSLDSAESAAVFHEPTVALKLASISIGLAWTGVGEAYFKDVALSAER